MTGSSVSEPMVVLVSGQLLVVVPRSTGAPVVDALRGVVSAGGSGDELITTLLAAGLAHLPSLAAVVREADGVRFLVRGSIVLDVETGPGEAVRLSAPAALATWREEVLTTASTVTVRDAEGIVQAEWFVVDVPGTPSPPVSATAVPALPENTDAEDADLDARLSDLAEIGQGDELTADVESVDPDPDDPGPVDRPTLAPPVEQAAEPGDEPSEADEVVVEPDVPRPDPEAAEPGSLTLAGPFDEDGSPFAVSAPAPPSSRDDGGDFDFAHLLEETQFHGVEAAAVRIVDDDHGSEPFPEPLPPSIAPVVDPGPVPPWSPPPERATGASSSALISGVPGLGDAASAAPILDHGPGDHDGMTIAKSQLAGALGGSAGPGASGPGAPTIKGPSVQAVHCSAGHPNPAHAEACRICGGPIADRSVQAIPRPVLGRLRFSSGPLVELDRPQVIGRRPTADLESSTAELPALVTLQDPDHSLSRTHAEIRFEGWEVFVVDRSKNGTIVDLPGQDPLRLRSGEPCLIVAGTRVHLSDSHDFLFEVGDR